MTVVTVILVLGAIALGAWACSKGIVRIPSTSDRQQVQPEDHQVAHHKHRGSHRPQKTRRQEVRDLNAECKRKEELIQRLLKERRRR